MLFLIMISCLVSRIYIKPSSTDVRLWNRLIILSLGLTLMVYITSYDVIGISEGRQVFNWITITLESLIFTCIVLVFTILWLVNETRTKSDSNPYNTALVIFNLIAVLLIPSIDDLVLFYVVIELQSYSLYLITGSQNRSFNASKASLLYFLMGGIASIIILLGTYFVYQETGSTNIADLRVLNDYLNPVGYSIVLFALLFKMGMAPLHKWSVAVYNYAPVSITAYISIIAKISILGWIYTHTNLFDHTLLLIGFYASLIIASYKPLFEVNLKVILAYSGILNFAYLLLTVITYDISFYIYLIQYALTHIILFMSIIAAGDYLKDPVNKWSPLLYLEQLNIPNRALIFTLVLSLFSLIGIPPLPGFYAKLYVLIGIIQENYILEAIGIVIFSVVATYYYANIIKTLLKAYKNVPQSTYSMSGSLSYLISITTMLLLSFYVYLPMLSEGIILLTI